VGTNCHVRPVTWKTGRPQDRDLKGRFGADQSNASSAYRPKVLDFCTSSFMPVSRNRERRWSESGWRRGGKILTRMERYWNNKNTNIENTPHPLKDLTAPAQSDKSDRVSISAGGCS
jgi:hypothetical protein